MERKTIKISISTLLLIIAIIAMIVMGVFIYKLSNDKSKEMQKSAELQSKIDSLNGTVNVLQGKINNISETINSNTTTETNTSSGKTTDSNVSPNKTTESNTISDNNTKMDSNYAKEYKKIIEKFESENPDANLTCDLIYFNNDNIPDLVIGKLDYWISLYIYENGNVYNPIDRWSYGVGGNTGYQYQEKKGSIKNHNSDFAGGIVTKTIFLYNSKKEFDELSATKKGTISEEADIAKINEALESYGGYFYNGKKISEQEYNNKLNEWAINIDDNNFIWLSGSKSSQEIKNQL